MVDGKNLMLFVATSWVLIITPGPDMLYVITRGVSQGRVAGLLSAVGVTLGILVHTLFAAFGLAVVLQTSALAFLVVKYLGALYLIIIGIRTFKDRDGFSLQGQEKQKSYPSIFLQGVLSNVLNPKVALFFLAFLPQFTDPNRGNVTLQMALLGITFALFGIAFLSLLGYFSGAVGAWLSRRPRCSSILGGLSGSLLVGLGVRLALPERK